MTNQRRSRSKSRSRQSQRALGLLLLALSFAFLAVSRYFGDMDGTAFCILAPLGLLLLCGRGSYIQ